MLVFKHLSITFNPYLAFRDISRAGGVCQLKSLSYLQYTTCNHSEQVFHTGVNLLSYKHATFH